MMNFVLRCRFSWVLLLIGIALIAVANATTHARLACKDLAQQSTAVGAAALPEFRKQMAKRRKLDGDAF